jgi:tRNA/rRNA methyltransferase
MPLRIVLVEPQEAGNVGAAARAMLNFGFDDLWIVGEHPQLLPVSSWWASGADEVLERVHFVPALGEALADAHVTVATTSMRGRTSPVTFSPASLAERFATMDAGQTLALVFGREDSGLTREEMELCQHTVTIPTNDRFPTMNLAQSVCVFCFSLSSITPAPQTRELPDAATVERIHQKARGLLLEIGFLDEQSPDRIYGELRALLARTDPDQREATILQGMLRQLEWALRGARR